MNNYPNNTDIMPEAALERDKVAYHENSMTAQALTILVAEIQSGRWPVGERLPGINRLADQFDFRRRPMQCALNRLARMGYLRQEARKGTFVISTNPTDSVIRGSISVAVENLEEDLLDPYEIAFRREVLQHIGEQIKARGLDMRTYYLPYNEVWNWDILTDHGLFEERTKGVISLQPFPNTKPFTSKTVTVPIVFYGYVLDDSLPCVTGDIWYGSNQLTEKLIEFGHREIVMMAKWRSPDSKPNDCSIETSFHSHEMALHGHEHALRKAGLTMNLEAIEESHSLHHTNLAGIRDFLTKYSHATAVMTQDSRMGAAVVSVAEMMGLQVPKDLSVVTRDKGMCAPGRRLTCNHYDLRSNIDQTLDLLLNLRNKRMSHIARILTRPSLIDGDTLAAPRGSAKTGPRPV